MEITTMTRSMQIIRSGCSSSFQI